MSSLHLAIASLILSGILLIFLRFLTLKTLKKYTSKLNGELVVKETYSRQRKLFLKSATQGLGPNAPHVEKSYWFYMAQKAIKFCENINEPKILVLGLGANTVTGIINKLNPKIQLTIVEIDPVIVEICKDYFELDKLTNATILVEDALEVINNIKYQKYFDVVISDIVTGEHDINEPYCYQMAYIDQLISITKSPGLIFFNHPVHTKTTSAHHKKFMESINGKKEIIKADKKLFKYPFGFNNFALSLYTK